MAGFRVLIVGAGIGGLTLANCLQHAGIDYLLLEGREEIGLHVGAGVGLEPNGDRILDQLGVRSDLEAELIANRCFVFRDINGKIMYERDGPSLVRQRTGYFPWVLGRRAVLESLYSRIQERDKVLVCKRVQSITDENLQPVVHCIDGSDYKGDIVVGSDGVNSAVRHEMWRLAELEEPGSIPLADKQYLTAEYRGLYGISDSIEGLDPGTMTMVVAVDQLCYWMVGKDGRVYWCLVEKLPQKLYFPNVPKYTDAEAVRYAEERCEKILLSDTAQVTFGDLWKRRNAYALVNVEEGNLSLWTAGKIVCIGDIVHKMTPESGQGANQAIETAAALANYLKRMVDSCSPNAPSSDEIKKCLRGFQAHRQPAARQVVALTNRNGRILSLGTPLLKFIVEHMFSILGDVQTNQISDRHIGADCVEFLPIPLLSTRGTMPFNPTQGVTKFESRVQRAVFALPLLVIPLVLPYTRKDPTPIFQILNAPVYLIWMLEGCRRANSLKPIQWIILFGFLAHIYGIAWWGNIWFYLHYLWSPIEVYAASDQRLLQLNYARTILPSIIITCLLPIVVIISDQQGPLAKSLLSLWSWVPVLLTLCHRLLAACIKDTTTHDRLYNTKADLQFIRQSIIITGLVSFVSFQYLAYSMSSEEIPVLYLIKPATVNHQSFGLQLGGLVWLLLIFRDLKVAGMTTYRWITLLAAVIAGVVFLGPSTTLCVGWMWREDILATKRHWAAIT